MNQLAGKQDPADNCAPPRHKRGSLRNFFKFLGIAKQLAQAKAERRIGHVGADPILPYKAFFDLGGTAARADALAIWIVQFVGREIRVLDYIEGVGQEIGYYIAELRKNKYDQALLVCRMTAMPITGRSTGPTERIFRTPVLRSK